MDQSVFKENFKLNTPDGDTHQRHTCTKCGFIHYQNPKIVTGILPVWDNKILLCKRAIEPRKNYWTFPCGYLENGETLEEGALREAKEEAGIDVSISGLLTVYSVLHVQQVHTFFWGNMNTDTIDIGPETLDTKFVALDSINWDELAFSSVAFALKSYQNFVDVGENLPQLGHFKQK